MVIDYIRSDCYRYKSKCDIATMICFYLKDSTFRWQVAFRLCQTNSIIKVLGLFLWVINRTKKTIQIPRTTRIGYGLYIAHGGPVVVNPSATIGNNCNLSQFSTIGSNLNHAAMIGDNVYIGPGVSVVENVVIGDCVTIGAGSVVTKNIPSNATAVGNYAKVVNFNNPGRFIINRWMN